MPGCTEDERIRRLFHDLQDIRIVVHTLHEGMVVYLAKPFGEGDVLLRRQFLIAEHRDLAAEPGVLDLRKHLIRHVPKVGAVDFGAHRPGERMDGDRLVTVGAV